MSNAATPPRAAGLAFPAVILAGLVALICVQTDLLRMPRFTAAANGMPETVVIAPRAFDYRASGDFIRDTASIDGPLIHVAAPQPIEIMTYQVSAADYAECVADGACEDAAPRRRVTGNVPVTGVNFSDATAYAAWLSQRTGTTWRLPSVEEWTFAAGSMAGDSALGAEGDVNDPAKRWLLAYQRASEASTGGPANPKPLGSFGTNEFGVADLSAVVWEWTSTCATRTTVDEAGSVVSRVEGCGVRYLEGRHRTPVNVFVRDALGGGCSVGVPPDNLGFRLVREPSWWERLVAGIAAS